MIVFGVLAAALLLLVAGVVAWQVQRMTRLDRVSRILADAAESVPWDSGVVTATLLGLLRSHLPHRDVTVADRPSVRSLSALIDEGRYVVVRPPVLRLPRAHGTSRDTPDGRLVAGLAALARASFRHADLEADLHREAVTDHLTGLWSYQHWLERLTVAAADLEGRQLGVVLLDCDAFKTVNRTYGFLDGDTVLATIGQRLRGLAAAEGWTFCRLGGDEFGGWRLHDGDPASFDAACEELAAVVAEPIMINGHPLRVTASVGRALPTTPGVDLRTLDATGSIDELIEAAQLDLRWRMLRKPGAVLTRHADREAVRRMIDGGEISVAYQPIVALADRSIWGCEALLRGRRGALGLIPPPVLVESAAEAQLLDAVTREVMEQALDVAVQSREVTGRPVTMTLNIETEQFHPASELLSWLAERVDSLGVPVVLELAERQPLVWSAERERLADELAQHGIGLGLDDLGAGHSRSEVLGTRPWDLVKLDRGLLVEDHRGRGPVMLRHVVAALADYDIGGTLLEGIETAAQERLALDLGIRYGQGYGLGTALPGSEFLDLARHGLDLRR